MTEADVMDRARKLWARPGLGYEDVARALAEYGDQRAAEGKQQMLVESTPLRDAIAREARAAALEEAAQVAELITGGGGNIDHQHISQEARKYAAALIRARALEEAAQRLSKNPRWVNAAAAIRALHDTPPQSEGGGER